MIFTQPTSADDALDFANKVLVGAPMTSSEWQDVPVELRSRAFFSSQVENAQFLQRAKDAIDDFLASNRDEAGALKTGSRAAFVDQMQQFLAANGIERTTGDVTDLASQTRLSLIFNTLTRQAQDFGYFKHGMSADILNEFPAQRFIRVIPVKEPRQTHSIYQGQVFLKTDPIWWRVINQDFGVPWGPWGWGCGHDVEDVDRDEAERLGLLKPGQQLVIPPKMKPFLNFNAGLQASTKNLDPDLLEKLKRVFKDQVVIEDGTIRWRGDQPPRPEDEMTAAELDALNAYTDTAYFRINNVLRNTKPDDAVRNQADAVSGALATLPDYQGQAYRRIPLSPDELTKYIPGNIVTENQFTSSSLDKSVVEGFNGNTFFSIKSKTGKDVSGFSYHEHEDEILFDQRTQFKVLSREQADGVWYIALEEL